METGSGPFTKILRKKMSWYGTNFKSQVYFYCRFSLAILGTWIRTPSGPINTGTD